MLARRELSSAQLRERLSRKGLDSVEIERTIHRLSREGLLDDRRTAITYARQAAIVKLRGPYRAVKELQARGISENDAQSAIAEVFGEVNEQTVLNRALARRLSGHVQNRVQFRRLYQYLLRQGFDGGMAAATLRARAKATAVPED